MKYEFTERSVSHETWVVEADTLEEACAEYERRSHDGSGPDEDSLGESELVEVIDEQGHEYDVDKILEIMPDEE